MVCNDRQLTQAQLEAGFQNQRTGVQKAIRPFSGEATPESLADYLNKEVFPVLQQARAKLNEVFLQVVDNAPSGNPLAFYFSDETGAADPTAGRIRLDAATQNTATTMRVSQENGRLVDVAPWLDVMAGGATSPLGTITLFDAINPGRFIRWDLDTMTDQGAYWDLGITVIESSHASPFVDGEGVVISFIPGVSSAGSTVPVTSLSPVAAETFIGNFTAAPAAPTARAGSSIAGTGLAYAAGGTLSVDATLAEILANGNTTGANDIHVSALRQLVFDSPGAGLGDIQSLGILNVRTASTMDFTAATGNVGFVATAGNFNMSGSSQIAMTVASAAGFVRMAVGGVNRFWFTGTGAFAIGAAADRGTVGELFISQGNTTPIWGQAVTDSYTDGSVTLPKIATQAAGTVLANVTAGVASPTAHALSTLAGSGLTYTNVTGVMDVDDVALTALADQADDTFLANISGGAAPPTAVALTTLAGAGLTGGANAVLAVGAGDGIDVNADDVAVDVTDIIDNVSITEVATNNIQRAALTGAITASAGSNATLFDSGASGAGLTGGGTAILAVGAGTGITVNANDVAVDADVGRHIIADADGVAFRKTKRRHFWYEEFDQCNMPGIASPATVLSGTESFLQLSTTNWFVEAQSNSGSIQPLVGIASHPGIVRLSTGTTSLDGITLYRGVAGEMGAGTTLFNQIYSAEFIVRCPTVTTVGFTLGFTDGLSHGTNSINFAFDTTTHGTTMFTWTSEGGTDTTTDTGVTISANTWNVYSILQESSGTVDFYIDDVLETTHTTNVPDAETGDLGIRLFTRTAAARTLDVDYVSFESLELTARIS